MPDQDVKPTPHDPPTILKDPDGLGPPPTKVPGTDWQVQPFFDPFPEAPGPFTPAPTEPLVPGGVPAPPPWWVEPEPKPTPNNPFTPDAQKAIKDKRAREEAERRGREEAERRAREQQKQELDDLKKSIGPAPDRDLGDFPEHQGDLWNV